MKRFSAFLLSVLVLFSCKAAQQENDKSLLWRISGNRLPKSSYLFGTIHLICPDDYLWTAMMQKSLAECKQVCFEMDMDDPKVLTDASAGMMNSNGKKLQDYFTADQWRSVSRFMTDSVGIDASMLQMMKPIALEAFLASKSVNCPIPVSYEANIMEQAQKAKQDIIGLEDVQEQIEVIGTLPDDSVAVSLVQMIDSVGQTRAEYAAMLAAYKQQDLPKLYQQIQNSKELGDAMGAFLGDRNKKWIPRMNGIMKGKPTFFAVGAGHLWGNDGVITLLRKAGYVVTPVR